VEISAPGGETNVSSSNGVLSTLNTGTQGPVADTYTYYQGTSMAAPHVAGIASLLYSRKPSLTPAQVLSYLQSTVTAFPGGSTCNTSNCGSGIVNAGAAVAAVPVSVLDKKMYLPLVLNGYPPTVGWTTMVSTDFEGAWPSPWVVYDNDGSTNGEYYWGKRNCRAYAGSFSGWGVGAGAQGSGLGCGANYPDNANSWMRYGPFSLSGTTAADLRFKLWLNSETTYDQVCRFASIDGANYWGTCTSGNTSGWTDRVLDLSNVYTLGNLLGQPNVWVAIVFRSDVSSTFAEGGYVDDIVLRKCPSGASCPAVLLQAIPSDDQVIESTEHLVAPR
jgi:subtilisin family serine protease